MSATDRLDELNRRIDQLRVARTVLRKKIRTQGHKMLQINLDSEERKMRRYSKSIDDNIMLRDELALRIESDKKIKITPYKIPDLPIGINPVVKVV